MYIEMFVNRISPVCLDLSAMFMTYRKYDLVFLVSSGPNSRSLMSVKIHLPLMLMLFEIGGEDNTLNLNCDSSWPYGPWNWFCAGKMACLHNIYRREYVDNRIVSVLARKKIMFGEWPGGNVDQWNSRIGNSSKHTHTDRWDAGSRIDLPRCLIRTWRLKFVP